MFIIEKVLEYLIAFIKTIPERWAAWNKPDSPQAWAEFGKETLRYIFDLLIIVTDAAIYIVKAFIAIFKVL